MCTICDCCFSVDASDYNNKPCSSRAQQVHLSPPLSGRISNQNTSLQARKTKTMVRKGKDRAAGKGVVGEGQLYVTCQQSRYALDAVDAPNSKEVSYSSLTSLFDEGLCIVDVPYSDNLSPSMLTHLINRCSSKTSAYPSARKRFFTMRTYTSSKDDTTFLSAGMALGSQVSVTYHNPQLNPSASVLAELKQLSEWRCMHETIRMAASTQPTAAPSPPS